MAKRKCRIQWYWFLELEVATCALFLIVGFILLLFEGDFISTRATVACATTVCAGSYWMYGYYMRLRERFGTKWIGRPIWWRVLWWALTVVIWLLWLGE